MNQAKRINLSIIFFSFIILIISFFYNYNYSFFLLIPSFLILLITSLPILISNEHNVFSPLCYLIYFIFLNLFLRNIYIIYDFPSKSYVDGIFLLYESKDLLIKPVLLTLTGFIFFTLGYLFYSYKPFMINKKPVIWNSKKLNLLSFVLSFISFISLIKFVISSKVNLLLVTLQAFSNYRGVSED